MASLINWLDDRTGIRGLIHEALYERVPGGARWRYVWGSTLVFTFFTQAVTGIFLWMSYSPSAQTAWESVYFIQYQMQGGWLLRGIHHFTAQAMVVLLVLHFMQVVIDGAYKAPREINFWLGLILMKIVLGLALTGYLLPWDQKGYWATNVATKIMGTVPVLGPYLQRLVVGGTEYGHHTLTRFFALHAGVLPGLLVLFLSLHVALFRRHGLTVKSPPAGPDTTFWPDQVLKDAVACLAVLAVVLGLTMYLGAELGAPADSAERYDAARPEWYFLFLFQFLKLFPGELEAVGAVYIPGAVGFVLILMPILGRWKLGHGFNIAFLVALFIGAGALTFRAVQQDRSNQAYLSGVADAHDGADRARVLAGGLGIPPEGAVSLLRSDPYRQGKKLFEQHCASCHSHTGDGAVHQIVAAESTAPNLYGIGTEAWVKGLLDPEKIVGPDFFGNTSHKEGEMADFVTNTLSELPADQVAGVPLALAVEAGRAAISDANRAQVEAGRKLLADADQGCATCHAYGEEMEDTPGYPRLDGWGSRAWLVGMIENPAGDRFYGENNDRMPAFHADTEILSETEIGLLADWLRGDWYRPSESAE